MVEALLARGADKNMTDFYGNAPLAYAAERDHVEILKTLLSAGAVKDKANNYGTTVLSSPSYYGHAIWSA